MKNFSLISKLIAWIFIIILPPISYSQEREEIGQVSKKINNLVDANQYFKTFEPFQLCKEKEPEKIFEELGDYTLLSIDESVKNEILSSQPDLLRLKIPVVDNYCIELLLYKTNILSENFCLKTDKNSNFKIEDEIVHYRGIVNGNYYSIASFTFSNTEVIGFYSDDFDNVTIGKLLKENRYIMYGDVNLVDIPNYNCDYLNVPGKISKNNLNRNPINTTSINCVDFYYEIDYDIFLN